MAQFARICVVGTVALVSAACGRTKHHAALHGGSGGMSGKAGAAAAGGSSGAPASGGATASGGADEGHAPAGAAGEAGVGGTSDAGGAGAPDLAGNGGAGDAGDAGAAGSSDLGTTKVTDVDSFRRAQYDALCRFIFGCNEQDREMQGLRFAMRTEQRCREVFEDSALREPAFADLDAKVRAGTIDMELAAVPACLDALERCEPVSMKRLYDDPACRAVFRGSSPLAGACSRAEDCANDARCVIGAACPGVCTARVPAGQACESESDCDDHDGPATCVASNGSGASTSTCQRVVLHRPLLDEACSFGVSESGELRACEDGLFCDATSGTCRSPLPVDSVCDSDDDVCAGGQFCRNGRCQFLTLAQHVGDDCNEAYEVCDLFGRLYCVNQKCELVGDGTEGAACHPIDYAAWNDCNSGLICLDPDSSVNEPRPDGLPRSICGKARAAGQPCEGNDDCASEYCQADHTCGVAYCCGEASCQSN